MARKYVCYNFIDKAKQEKQTQGAVKHRKENPNIKK